MPAPVRFDVDGAVATVTIDRPQVRNAVDAATADALAQAFRDFDADDRVSVAVLTGAGGTFCAGFDLKSLASGQASIPSATGAERMLRGPMGPTRMNLSKPVIAAIEGHAVAGGLELALWCDLRIAARNAVFGVFNRRFGVPLIDLGTVRLPRAVGQARALDLILTGREVRAEEALQMGLVQRVVEPGQALHAAQALAAEIARFPQAALRADRSSVIDQWSFTLDEAARVEHGRGVEAIATGEAQAGARRFAAGEGRHGEVS